MEKPVGNPPFLNPQANKGLGFGALGVVQGLPYKGETLLGTLRTCICQASGKETISMITIKVGLIASR